MTATSGFLDFQFNPVNSTSQSAVALISNFKADGTLVVDTTVPSPQVTGDVVGGPLPAPLTFTNSTSLNEFFQQFTYGTFFSFVLSLSGPALSSPNGTATAGSTFGVGLYNSGQSAIFTDQISGFAGSVDVNLDGSTTTHLFSTGPGVPSVVTFEAVSVPEPGTMLLLGFGAAGLVWLRKNHRFFL